MYFFFAIVLLLIDGIYNNYYILACSSSTVRLIFSALLKPCASPSYLTYATGTPLFFNALTITSDCEGGTTLSSAPWKKMTGQVILSAENNGDRSS